jgi:hypothetical protein
MNSSSNHKIDSTITTIHQKKSPSTPISGSLKKLTGNKHDREEMDREDANSTKLSGIETIEELFSKKKEWRKNKQKPKDPLLQQQPTDDQQRTSLTNRNTKKSKVLHGDRSDLERLQSGEWVDDGLGGKFNSEGFTGRREEQTGFKVYKAHVLNKKGFGTTSQCPFDCDCCYI